MTDDEATVSKSHRQRVRRSDDAITILTLGISGLLIYAVYSASHSLPLTMCAGFLCGSAAIWFMPRRNGDNVSDDDKRKWVVWFAPALLIEGVALVYFLRTATPNSEVLGPSGLAWIVGATAAATYRILKWSAP